jgi:TonB family protein
MQSAGHNSTSNCERLLHGYVYATGLLFAAMLLTSCAARAESNPPHHATADRSGEIPTHAGLTLHLTADLGSVRIETIAPKARPVVHYAVHLETDAREPIAQSLLERYALSAHETPSGVFVSGSLPSARAASHRSAQFWVQFVISVPTNYNVEVTTGAGDIETSDIGGRVSLSTEGGNIRTGRIGLPGMQAAMSDRPVGKLETEGGHVTVLDVSGDLDAYTAGGHIQAGNIAGNAKLRTGGGHIRAGQIKGTAHLETDGGNITVGEAGSYVGVRTGGGQIDFGEVHGSVHAQTAGGGIRVMYVAGPMEVETSGGSICMTRVVNTVRAETGGGTIRAWITPDASDGNHAVRLPGPSQLTSSTGDIIVFLPRNIAATIDATVENGGAARIEADPALPLNVQARQEGPVHAVGVLNGGGGLLKLHTHTGKIRLQYVDAEASLRQSLLEEQKQRLAQRLNDRDLEPASLHRGTTAALAPNPPPAPVETKGDWLDFVENQLEIAFFGAVHEDSQEFMKHLVYHPTPDYPPLAERAGLQGRVRLQVRLKADGSLAVEKVLEGEPALVDASTAAIRQWRATPEELAGKKVDVVSTVVFDFQLRRSDR